ncbi:MAG: flagellin FliC, partial [Magnetococcales bacterium]|nr:flagellin FliC [Magnetococcales bacterium]
MYLSISTNLFAINAQRNLMRSTNALGTTYQRLSSGLRINSA